MKRIIKLRQIALKAGQDNNEAKYNRALDLLDYAWQSYLAKKRDSKQLTDKDVQMAAYDLEFV